MNKYIYNINKYLKKKYCQLKIFCPIIMRCIITKLLFGVNKLCLLTLEELVLKFTFCNQRFFNIIIVKIFLNLY